MELFIIFSVGVILCAIALAFTYLISWMGFGLRPDDDGYCGAWIIACILLTVALMAILVTRGLL